MNSANRPNRCSLELQGRGALWLSPRCPGGCSPRPAHASPASRCPALAAGGRKRCPHSTSGRRGAKLLAAAAGVGAEGKEPFPESPLERWTTHVESGVLGAEEREGHREGLQPRATVVLLRSDGVAALRAERVEVGEGHRRAHPARPEPQGCGQQQRPGSAAGHRQDLEAGLGQVAVITARPMSSTVLSH